MKKWLLFSLVLVISLTALSSFDKPSTEDWGFFGHKRINRLAIFTLPPAVFGFYKENVEYITEHAVDPDKRRYATVHEAVRHYIDLDEWGVYPFEEVPRSFPEAIKKYLKWHYIPTVGDTIALSVAPIPDDPEFFNLTQGDKTYKISIFVFDKFYLTNIFNKQDYYEGPWSFDVPTVKQELKLPWNEGQLYFEDSFSQHGILPFHLLEMQNRLASAFAIKDPNYILRLSADFGHYLGDAHVPLHTTSNYNGQLTNQLGIHAFWESRIPELLADQDWDFFVGQAAYIEDPATYFWEVVLASNALVADVLSIEKRLSEEFPEDAQFCQELRNGYPVRTQCVDFTKAYDAAMQGMVEERMRASVLAIGSAWYTAWVDGGRPNLDSLFLGSEAALLEEPINKNFEPKRAHDN